MQISFDKLASSGYITFTKNPIRETVPMGDNILFDLDTDGNIVGMEIIGVSPLVFSKLKSKSKTISFKNSLV